MTAHPHVSSSFEAPSGPRSSRASFAQPMQTIGAYRVGETVGRGSFGKVKKGCHLKTGEPVAIKILNRQKLKKAKMGKKIYREIEILRLFSHPNICRLYEVISTPTDIYLIVEYLEGGELYDYIVRREKVSEAEARHIFQQIVCAIEYCHHFRVVHRDLKPENILLGPGLQVKLIDFGLSNIMRDGEFLTTSCGSPNYAAPEVISGKLYFGPEVDVWSCGVILYALLCGCLPFDEDSIPLLFGKIKKGRYVMPSDMPSGPQKLIEQILVVDPLVRLTIPQIRDNAWFNVRLPAHLAYHKSMFTVQEDRIHSVLASETAKKLGIRETDVRRELKRGYGAAFVAYNILLEAKRRREITAEAKDLVTSPEDSCGAGSISGSLRPTRPVNLSGDNGCGGGGSGHFKLHATERELNMGLMLSQSPGVEIMLNSGDATAHKAAYNTGQFVPASVHGGGSIGGGSFAGGSVGGGAGGASPGSFSMTRRPGSLCGGEAPLPASLRGGEGLLPPLLHGLTPPTGIRAFGSNRSVATPQQGRSLSEYPRVGSVAQKHAVYTAKEEQFLVDHNCGWRVGLMTDWHANRALQAVYGVLRSYGMEWKVVSPFHLLARTTAQTWRTIHHREMGVHPCGGGPSPVQEKTAGKDDCASLPEGGSKQVYLGIYLFRIHERHDKGFLVDFSILKNTLLGLNIVLYLSDALIRYIS